MEKIGTRETLRANLEGVRLEIREAAERGGRTEADITLVAVTKYVGREEISALIDLGVAALGENRIQGAEEKIVRAAGVSWHMIGHLQRNKVKKALRFFDWVESVDSLRLAAKLEEEAEKSGRAVSILLEINVGQESAKTGLPPGEAIPLLREMAGFHHVEARGFMAMAPAADDPEASRPFFRKLRGIQEEARDATGLDLPDLSMGMSQDFAVGIEEGATIVRIGQALYRKRN